MAAALLLSDEPECRAIALRATKKRVRGRPGAWDERYNRAALLDMFFSFLKNHDDVERLKAGVFEFKGREVDPDHVPDLIARLSPLAAKTKEKAYDLTVESFGSFGIVVTREEVKNAYYQYMQRYPRITTPAAWAAFREKQKKQFPPSATQIAIQNEQRYARWESELEEKSGDSAEKTS